MREDNKISIKMHGLPNRLCKCVVMWYRKDKKYYENLKAVFLQEKTLSDLFCCKTTYTRNFNYVLRVKLVSFHNTNSLW